MNTYLYDAIDSTGEEIKGEIKAESVLYLVGRCISLKPIYA